MSIKDTIKDEAGLETVLDYKIGAITAATKREVGKLEQDYAKFRRYQRIGFLLIAAAFLLPNSAVLVLEVLFANLSNFWSTVISIGVFLISFMLCSYFGFKFIMSGSDVIRQFNAKVDTILFGAIFNLLGVKGELIEHTVVVDKKSIDGTGGKLAELIDILRAHFRSLRESPESEQVLASLTTSELITEPFNTTRLDNVFAIDIVERRLMVSELHLEHITGSGRSRQVKQVFKGYFVALPLRRALTGKTFISTDGDTHGFAHRTYWSTLLEADNQIKETKFEWNDFEELLHVATDNDREAREVLTPQFMSDLYDWWKKHEQLNIRIAFIGNLMYLLFPDNQIRFEKTVSKVEPSELKEYMFTIARPLMHVLHLVEEVKR
ncbi:MAG: DUF3137 domain-containing protein [Patescibacteria group bacterium]